MKISIIGAGRAGGSLGIYFKNKGLDVLGYYSKSFEHAKEVSKNVGGTPFLTLEDSLCADIIILAVPDDLIEKISDEISKYNIKGKHIIHLSGACSSKSLYACKNKGAKTYSLHPPLSFSTKKTIVYEITFAFEGEDLEELKDFFDEHEIKYIIIKEENKPLYHAAAVMASNYITSLLHSSFKMLLECGFTLKDAQSFFAPLIYSAVNNTIEKGSSNAITGPIARGDINTLSLHLDAIKDEDIKKIYKVLGKNILNFATLNDDIKNKIDELLK